MKKNRGNLEGFDIAIVVVFLIGLLYFLFRYVPFFVNMKDFVLHGIDFSAIGEILNLVAVILALFFMTIIGYSAVRVLEIRKKEHAHLHEEIHEYAHHQAEKEAKQKEKQNMSGNPRWVHTLELVFSSNPNDWRLAIIEADSILEEMLKTMGFKGETVGEMLRAATLDNPTSFASAHEVHAIRNRIAHEGSEYILSHPEAKRIIAVYEQIFRHYGFI
jgi:hypothetical protein